jgi:hypothetical protein
MGHALKKEVATKRLLEATSKRGREAPSDLASLPYLLLRSRARLKSIS